MWITLNNINYIIQVIQKKVIFLPGVNAPNFSANPGFFDVQNMLILRGKSTILWCYKGGITKTPTKDRKN